MLVCSRRSYSGKRRIGGVQKRNIIASADRGGVDMKESEVPPLPSLPLFFPLVYAPVFSFSPAPQS